MVLVFRGRLVWSLVAVTTALAVVAGVLVAQPADGASSGLAAANKKVQELYKGSNFGRPPVSAPKPQKGKKIWHITVALNTPSTWAKASVEAGKAIGWSVKVWDGKFAPPVQLEGIQQAIANKADGIMIDAIDCSAVKSGLQQARRAGIKIVVSQGVDCNTTSPGNPSLFDGTVRYTTGGLQTFNYAMYGAKADWITVKTKGKGRILYLKYGGSFKRKWGQTAFDREIKKVCSGCKTVQTIEFPASDLFGPALRQKVEQALLKHPDINAVVAPFDDVIVSTGVNAAIRATGRGDKIFAIGEGAYPASMKEIRQGTGLDATMAFSFDWDSWAMIDAMNRLFHGQKPVASGSGIQLIDKQHNASKDAYTPPVDFRAAYKKAWNGK